jgi:hypothetical protein
VGPLGAQPMPKELRKRRIVKAQIINKQGKVETIPIEILENTHTEADLER